MNEKPPGILRSILTKSWHEPHHFFFWLALLSPLVFAMMTLTAGTAARIPTLVSWLALAAIIGFVLGVPAFVLSWIPALRPWFARLLQHKLLVLACLATPIALFYAVENWRGRNAWNKFQHEWEARGVQFDLASIIPPSVPDDQNFFASAPWELLRFTKSNDVVVWKYDQATREASTNWLDYSGSKPGRTPDFGDLLSARRIDLRAWQEFYHASNHVIAAAGQSFANASPGAADSQTPARDILLALGRSEPTLEQLRMAARRPHARFWINYEDGFGALIPHLPKTKGVATYLRLRAAALLADGQTDAAFADVILAFRLNDALRDEPILISQLVRIASLHINLLAVWDGLADQRWSDAQLVALERELAQVDILAGYHAGMSGERAGASWTMDFLRRTRNLDLIGGLPGENGGGHFGDQMMEATGKIIFGLAPSGWFEQNKISLGRMHVEVIRPSVDQEKQIVSPEHSRRTSALIETQAHRRTPYNLFTGMLIPALDKVAKKSANAQTYVNLARIACALERHRLAHGNYPETLDALVPQFIAQLPHDVINGEPLKYRRTDERQFVLYSVGWNETDDGGTVVMRKGKNANVNQDLGDWVWRYPAK
jgi:hypothetical protein